MLTTAPIKSFFCSFAFTALSINKNNLFNKRECTRLLMQGLVNATTAFALSILSRGLSKTLPEMSKGKKNAIRFFTNMTLAFAIKKKEGLFPHNLSNKIFTASVAQLFTNLNRSFCLVQDVSNLNLTDLDPCILKISNIFTESLSFLAKRPILKKPILFFAALSNRCKEPCYKVSNSFIRSISFLTEKLQSIYQYLRRNPFV